jgi:hypothetical protein
MSNNKKCFNLISPPPVEALWSSHAALCSSFGAAVFDSGVPRPLPVVLRPARCSPLQSSLYRWSPAWLASPFGPELSDLSNPRLLASTGTEGCDRTRRVRWIAMSRPWRQSTHRYDTPHVPYPLSTHRLQLMSTSMVPKSCVCVEAEFFLNFRMWVYNENHVLPMLFQSLGAYWTLLKSG